MNFVKKSKRLSFLLRHCQEPLYIDLQGGWASVESVLFVLDLSRHELNEIVATDSKGRYAFDITEQK